MSEKRILIASLLKPINDTRMYEKIGLSLSKLPGVQVHVVGYDAPLPQAPENVYFHPAFTFRRLSWGRIVAQLKYKRLLESIKPDLVICCTHELLTVSRKYCAKYAAKLVYDVQENYVLNLTSQQNYPPLLRNVLAWQVNRTELRAAPYVSHFLVAERSYADELHFLQNGKYTFIENKYKPGPTYKPANTPVSLADGPLKLLYSGTIAEVYGIFEAVQLTEKLHQIDKSITLTIIGYCASSQTLSLLRELIINKPYITLIGGEKLVPHEQILKAIQESDVALLPYHPNPSTARCIPTKLYEYMAYALPQLVQHNALWESIINHQHAGLMIDFRLEPPKDLLLRIRQQKFYTSGIPQDIYWQQEEEKLLLVVQELLMD